MLPVVAGAPAVVSVVSVTGVVEPESPPPQAPDKARRSLPRCNHEKAWSRAQSVIISADNVDTLAAAGFDHVLATRLHRDPTCTEALHGASGSEAWRVPVPEANSAACEVTLADGRRAVVVASFERWERDRRRTAAFVARIGVAPTEDADVPRRSR
jgi:hypothetical protein